MTDSCWVLEPLLKSMSSVRAGVVHALPGEHEQQQRQDEDDREQEPRNRRAVAHSAEPEGLTEQIQVDEQRGVVRIALAVGDGVRLREVLERADEADHEVVE